MPSRVPVCLSCIFSRTMSLSASIGGARRHLAEEIDACIRQDRQAKMYSDPDRDDFLLITRYCFALCRGLISPNTYLCILSRSVARLSGIVARLTATTAILSRMCR